MEKNKIGIEKKGCLELGELAAAASLSSGFGRRFLTIGDEDGKLHVLSGEKELKGVLVEQDACLVDHVWVDETKIAHTSGKDVKIFDVQKEKEVSTFVGHQKVS
jgi:hypothetical protein